MKSVIMNVRVSPEELAALKAAAARAGYGGRVVEYARTVLFRHAGLADPERRAVRRVGNPAFRLASSAGTADI